MYTFVCSYVSYSHTASEFIIKDTTYTNARNIYEHIYTDIKCTYTTYITGTYLHHSLSALMIAQWTVKYTW